MCYYNGIRVSRDEYIRLKNLEKAIAKSDILNRPVQSGFEYTKYPVIKPIEGKEDIELVEMEWGFIPHYIRNREELLKMRLGGVDEKTKKYKPAIVTLNAIGEELFDKVTYKQAAQERHCLVVSSGFFEWRHINTINKRTGKPNKTTAKYPYYISLKDKEYFYMAGIWTPWTDKDTGEYVESFSIVTTKANSLMEQVHNSKKRMPTILTDDLAYEWLFGNMSKEEITKLATYQYAADEMFAYPLAKDFLNAHNPFEEHHYEELPELV